MTLTAPAASTDRAVPALQRWSWASGVALSDRRNRGRLATMVFALGLCTLVLLCLGSVGPTSSRYLDVQVARTPTDSAVGDGFRFRNAAAPFDGHDVVGLQLQAGTSSPAPPGVDRFPAPGEAFVSPALARLLADPDQATLRELVGPVAGQIAADALTSDRELWFYQGVPAVNSDAGWANGWGGSYFPGRLDSSLWVLLTTGAVIVLAPLLLFIGLAARLGSARRERRDSVLRLLGASRGQLRTLVAAEALIAAIPGVLFGSALFIGLQVLAERFDTLGALLSSFAEAPSLATTAAAVIGVPVLGVLAALRGTQARLSPLPHDPAGRRPRAWWRWALLAAAIGSSALAVGIDGSTPDAPDRVSVICGVVLLWLFSVAALVGLLTDRIARTGRARTVAGDLARGRLIADGGVSTRAAAALGTVLAGSIALMSLLTAEARPGDDPETATLSGTVVGAPVDQWERIESSLSGVDGVDSVAIGTQLDILEPPVSVQVGNCIALRQSVALPDCMDGVVYARTGGREAPAAVMISTGAQVPPRRWTPSAVTELPVGTPSVSGADVEYFVTISAYAAQIGDAGRSDDRITVSARVAPDALAGAQRSLAWLGFDAAGLFRPATESVATQSIGWVRVSLIAGGLLVLGICGLGLWLLAVEQIRERRRAFALARAAGVPVRVLGRSLMVESLLPVLVAVPVAVVLGGALSLVLQLLRGSPYAFDWTWALAASAVAVGVTVFIALGAAARLRHTTGATALRTE